MSKKDLTELEVYELMQTYESHTFGEIDQYQTPESIKSYHGYVIERNIFEYEPNPNPFPDLDWLDLEIKSTPMRETSKGLSSKERLVLNIINYLEENWNDFYDSSFWKKNKKLLIVFYLYKRTLAKTEQKILKTIIFKYPQKDLKIIINDWLMIADKVLNGRAHEISERDTLYLAACTKGANSDSVRKQPFSEILAKQRAYSLKPSYMTTVYNDYVTDNKRDESIINEASIELGRFNLEDYVQEKFKIYYGKSVKELAEGFGIDLDTKSKSINAMIVNKILGLKNDIKHVEEFKKAYIIPKTIRIETDGKVKESMSFPVFKFTEIVNQEWEDSDIYDIMSNGRFLFIIFKYDQSISDYRLSHLTFWSMPEDDLLEVEKVWKKTVEVIRNGVKLSYITSGTTNNLPKKKENRIMHVRPHGRNAEDKLPLPDGRLMTKQCFWLNADYILKIITE